MQYEAVLCVKKRFGEYRVLHKSAHFGCEHCIPTKNGVQQPRVGRKTGPSMLHLPQLYSSSHNKARLCHFGSQIPSVTVQCTI